MTSTIQADARPFAWRAVGLSAVGVFALLAALGGRYGLHRDEWYFIEAGHHPAWSYPDQPALIPLAARAWWAITGGNIFAFRLVPALVAGVVVILAGLTARELGGGTTAQGVTAAAMATSSTLLASCHLFSTTAFDAAATAAVVLLLVRAVRTGQGWHWMACGVALGVALNVKILPGLVAACCVAGLLLAGPRGWLRSPWPYLAGLLALALAVPMLIWQAAHQWPQLRMASRIAGGGSGSSVERWLVIPLQLTVPGPLAFGLVVAGLIWGWRGRTHRWIVVASALLLAAIVASGGKPYYTLGLLPAVLALAGPPTARWLATGAHRRRALAGILVANLAGGAILTLPVVPETAVNPLREINYDLAEQIGWPHLIDVVEEAQRTDVTDPAHTVIITANYGEAGALAAARRSGRPLLPVYSGHNGFADWGPPPATTTHILWVGETTDPRCHELAPVATPGITNEEATAAVYLCTVAGEDWTKLWAEIRHLS